MVTHWGVRHHLATLVPVTQQQWGQPGSRQQWQQPQQPWGQQPTWGQPPAGYQPAGYQQAGPYGVPAGRVPQGGMGYPPPQPPRRGGNPVRAVLIGLIAAVVVGFFFMSLMSFLFSDDLVDTSPAPGQPPITPVEPPVVPPVAPVEPPGGTPTTPVQPSVPAGVVPEPDFDPPPLPMPETYEQAEQWLVNNALYSQSVAVPTDCALGRIDVSAADPDELETHLNNLTACLTMVWLAPMERAGFQMPRPPVTVYSQPITTACGELELYNAVYCSGDQRVYYATNLHHVFGNTPEVISNPFLADNVIGHEFGHAIQARSGILISSIAFEQQLEAKDAIWMTRRSEQQADCFSGMFLGAVADASQMTQGERAALSDVSYAIGDDVLTGQPNYDGDHGQGANRQRWFRTGQAESQVGVCNTWVVPNKQVR